MKRVSAMVTPNNMAPHRTNRTGGQTAAFAALSLVLLLIVAAIHAANADLDAVSPTALQGSRDGTLLYVGKRGQATFLD